MKTEVHAMLCVFSFFRGIVSCAIAHVLMVITNPDCFLIPLNSFQHRGTKMNLTKTQN